MPLPRSIDETRSESLPPLHELAGKVAFITGGSSGIGLGIARACSAAGMKVVVTYLTDMHIEAARLHFDPSSGRAFHAIKVDVRNRDGMASAAREAENRFGSINLVCANAGIGITASISELTANDWRDALDTNLMGVVHTIAPFVEKAASGLAPPMHVVATASMSGMFHGASTGVYTTTKYAVVGMMEALRAELQPIGVGVSVFCPGLVRSSIFDQYRHRSEEGVLPLPRERIEKVMQAGMDPVECGERVLVGIRRNDMYIITHPEYRRGFSERSEAILGAFDAYTDPVPRAREEAERVVLRHRVYAEELERCRRRSSATAEIHEALQ